MLDGFVAFNASKGKQERRSVPNADGPLLFDLVKPSGQVRWTGEEKNKDNNRSETWDEKRNMQKKLTGDAYLQKYGAPAPMLI